jgi:hypothetical protein
MINLSVRVSEMSAYVGGALVLIGKVSYTLLFVASTSFTWELVRRSREARSTIEESGKPILIRQVVMNLRFRKISEFDWLLCRAWAWQEARQRSAALQISALRPHRSPFTSSIATLNRVCTTLASTVSAMVRSGYGDSTLRRRDSGPLRMGGGRHASRR